MDGTTTKGFYAGFNKTTSIGEANLGDLGSADINMFLWQYGTSSTGGIFGSSWDLDTGLNAATPYIAQIQIRTDGSIWMDATLQGPALLPGDINGDGGNPNLADAITALQVAITLEPTSLNLAADINGDQRIGIEEVIYVLRIISTAGS
jgi:hypothetical protein